VLFFRDLHGVAGCRPERRTRLELATLSVDVLLGHEVRAVAGSGSLEQVSVEETTTATRRTLDASAMVVLIGAQPHTDWLPEDLALDTDGYILTGPQLGAAL
jgi:thioredoxin reductase (NADPH)